MDNVANAKSVEGSSVFFRIKDASIHGKGEGRKEQAKQLAAEAASDLGIHVPFDKVQIVSSMPPLIKGNIIFKPDSNGAPQLFYPNRLFTPA
jgi:hypothetical protein